MKMVISYVLCLIIFKVGVFGQTDPCVSHTTINDTHYRTDYWASVNGSIPWKPLSPGWYRYTGTTDGVMSTICPESDQCGANQQAWINASLPAYSEGEVSVHMCIRTADSCCSMENRIVMKNCNHFFAYELVALPPGTNFCFNVSAVPLVTVSTTTTTTTTTATTTTKTTTSAAAATTTTTKATTTTTKTSASSSAASTYTTKPQTTSDSFTSGSTSQPNVSTTSSSTGLTTEANESTTSTARTSLAKGLSVVGAAVAVIMFI